MKNHKFCPLCGSILLAKKIDGLDRPVCLTCGWIYYANPLPSAVAFVLREGKEVLLIKRGVQPGKGKWALPSGFVEADELPQQTVIRELKEETGINGTLSHLIGVYTEPTKMYGNVLLIAYDVKYQTGKPRARTDTVDAKFFPLSKIPRIPFDSHRAIIRDGLHRNRSNGMNVNVLKSKITEATITHTKLFYKGSMGIDSAVMKEVNILPGEKVHVLNYDNGKRLETYTIEEKAGSGRIVLYGPASKKGEVGQRLCILSYASMTYDSARVFKAKVVTLDSKNRIKRR
ncbi:MAG: aspartate 1-decarboxylase [candidate division WOR-3 bacterium]|nr:aspartate 1-decarboxylase [candidate division WOR-3 bacterium]